MNYGPKLPISEEIGAEKHRLPGETFEDAMRRIARALADDDDHFDQLLPILLDQRFLPAGRVQSAAGNFRNTTAFNCFVSGTITDSMDGIMTRLHQSALTMQRGGGIGYDFSTIRPRGDLIEGTGSKASGPVSFMEPYDATCGTIASAGDRRGAQMGVLRVDHPDIFEFIRAKGNTTTLTRFNVSVAVTDAFMYAVTADAPFDLVWGGKVYQTIRARDLWDEIMSMTWDWAEPGVLFIDAINRENNLWYCETIAATNPCGEQPLPPFGACLLGSFNWVKYVVTIDGETYFDSARLREDTHVIVRAMDNVIDRTVYPLPEQEEEAKAKRRMGLGATGVANALEILGIPYGTEDAAEFCEYVMQKFTNECYRASALLAAEKGAFPLYDRRYLASPMIGKLEPAVEELIVKHGIRNSHLTSIAPTGTISLAADNPSSGIEPPFLLSYDRRVRNWDGSWRTETVDDYAYRVFGVAGRTANDLAPEEHVRMLVAFQKWVDSACSKTCNIGADVDFEAFKDVYIQAWQGGAKGCTTFRSAGKRFGVLNATPADEPETAEDETEEGASCTFDPSTGKRTCE